MKKLTDPKALENYYESLFSVYTATNNCGGRSTRAELLAMTIEEFLMQFSPNGVRLIGDHQESYKMSYKMSELEDKQQLKPSSADRTYNIGDHVTIHGVSTTNPNHEGRVEDYNERGVYINNVKRPYTGDFKHRFVLYEALNHPKLKRKHDTHDTITEYKDPTKVGMMQHAGYTPHTAGAEQTPKPPGDVMNE